MGDAKKKLPSALEPKKPKKKVDAYTSGGVKAAEKKDQKKDDTLNFGLQMSVAFGNTITRVGAKLAKSKGGSPEQGALKLQIDELEQARMKACNSVLGLDKKKAVAEQKYGSGAISKQKAATAKLDQKAALKKGKLTPTKGDAEKAKPVAAKKEDAKAPAKKAAAKPKEMTEQRMLQLYRQTMENDEEDSADLGASLALGGLYTSRPSNVGEATYGGAAGSGSGKGSAKPKKKDEEKKDKKDAKKKAAGSGKKKAAGSAKKKPAASEKKDEKKAKPAAKPAAKKLAAKKADAKAPAKKAAAPAKKAAAPAKKGESCEATFKKAAAKCMAATPPMPAAKKPAAPKPAAKKMAAKPAVKKAAAKPAAGSAKKKAAGSGKKQAAGS